jgi:ABC-type transport system involved in cytochrome bd biosynthesis fused ATPase/permease subunit
VPPRNRNIHSDSDSDDPVLARRAQLGRLAETGQRVGYVFIGISVAAFVVAAVTSFAGWAVTATLLGLLGATIVLPPAIVLGYGVKKAEREDPGTGR